MNPLSLRALVALKLLVLLAFWSFGSARTAVSLADGAVARVQARNSDRGDLFGGAVAMSRDGRVLVVGADMEDSRLTADDADNGLSGAGAAYVFERDGDRWRQSAYLKATIPTPGGGFGFSVAVSDDGQTIAIGAPFEPGAGSGSVHLFRRGGLQWSPVAHLPAPPGAELFGVGIDLSERGAELVVASVGTTGGPQRARTARAHVFAWRADRWAEASVLEHAMGDAVDAMPRVALAGHGHRVALASGGPAVLLFESDSVGWKAPVDVLVPSAAAPARAVHALALSSDGRTLAVVRDGGDVDVHVQPTGAPWTPQAHLRASADAPALGHRLALSADGDTLVTSAADDAPAVYRFRRHAGQWRPLPPLLPLGTGQAQSGSTPALSPDGRTLAVGSRFEAVSRWPWPFAPAPAAGLVHLYTPV